MLSWYQTEIGLYGVGVGEAPHIVECGNEPHGGHRSNPWNGHEKRADWMLPSDVLELLVRSCDAVVEHFDDHKQTSGGVRAVGPTKPPMLQNATHHARWVLAMIADCRQSRSPMDPQVCSIRRFRAEEWAAYRNLRLRSLIDAPDAFGSTLERESAWPERHWADRVSTAADSQTRLLLVAEIGMDPVGLVSGFIDPAEPEIAHVFQMWVAPHARGCGCGSMLLQTVLEWVRGTNARAVTLCVTCGNSSARRLYERAGFTSLGDPKPLRSGSTVFAQPMVLAL